MHCQTFEVLHGRGQQELVLCSDDGFFDIGEIVACILIYEEDGQRGKD